jgi:poly-gamma-glutamate hydrolase-like protein
MAIDRVEVRKSRADQDYLRNRREHLSVDTQTLAAAGVAVGQQVRVKRSEARYALYTVARDRNENGHKIVRMSLTAKRRLGTDQQFDADLDTRVVHPTMSDQDAQTNSEFVERLFDDGRQRSLIANAPHGGDIEVHTDEQAERTSSQLVDMAASSWLCKGYHENGAEKAWHITSVDIHSKSFPLLDSGSIEGSRMPSHSTASHRMASSSGGRVRRP